MGLLVIYAARRELILVQMHGTFLQKVILTLIAALFASGLVEFYKNIIQRADEDINKNWRVTPSATAHP